MLSRSGFGWNDKTNVIDCSDQVWNEYVAVSALFTCWFHIINISLLLICCTDMIFVLFQTDSQPRNMRCKSWPDYKDWVTIFGKDRATGEAAKQFSDVASKQPHARKYNPGIFFLLY